jgi:2-polyprenyl-6-methoxyphenol hydroxylase-like FAD-dependent oxidoreductase
VTFQVDGDRAVALDLGRGRDDLLVFLMFPAESTPGDRDGQQAAIRTAFTGAGWEVPALLAAMPQAPGFYFDELSQIVMPAWSTGRVALVGDAGYGVSAMSGRGTSQALLGAYVLAGELSIRDDPATAFGGYERALRDYVAANQKTARMTPGAFTAAPLTQEMVDAMAAASAGEDSADDLPLMDYSSRRPNRN